MARAEKRPDPRCARAAAVGAAPFCLPRVGDRARPLRPERAPKCPLSAKSGAGPSAPPVSLGFRRRRPVNLESSCSEGAQDSCELGRKSPEPREGSEPRRRLQVGPATRGDRERLGCLSSPPTPERRWSSRATETRELLMRLPGPERSSRTGLRGAPTARRKSGVLTVCQARARAVSLNRSGKYPTSGTYSKSRRWLDLNPDFF
uniref:Uncharacterized protein n=1 Tax=Colobus angolensis palliatus TaxID=336983 RepID=A0A2K5JXR2_COLAP